MQNKHLSPPLSIVGRARKIRATAWIRVKPFAKHVRQWCTHRHITYLIGGAVTTLVLAYTAAFYWPHTIVFSYSGHNCVTAPVILPNLATKQRSTNFDITHESTIRIGSIPVYSHSACVVPTQPPQEKASETLSMALPGNTLLKKTIRVKTPDYPAITRHASAGAALSTKDMLKLNLTTEDEVFTYQAAVNDTSASCTKEGTVLRCDIPQLKLAQGTPYELTIQRVFKEKKAGIAFRQAVTTVEPVNVASTSIAAGQKVYDMPGSLTVTLTKPASSLGAVRLYQITGGVRQEIPITADLAGATITIKFGQPLPRDAQLALSIDRVTSEDGGYLPALFELPFTTSGGPKVQGINIGSAKVTPGGAITVTFDSALAGGQNLAEFIRIESGSTVAAGITVQGNRVTIRPAELGRCTPFTVKIIDGLKNEYGVSGGSGWQFKSRIICQTVFSIGTSVQGRSITAYRFGTGPSKIIFVGGTHGDEKSSVQILNRWVEQLELNPGRIPAHQTIIVIPNLNPDGYAANRRTNAHNVDLNRNFPSNSWKSGVTMPDKSYLEYGGGAYPLSEPESQALASYTLAQQPRMVLTYHAAGGVVVPNGAGDSNAVAIQYGKKSTVGYMSNSQTGSFFEYDTTGAYEDWLYDKHALPALLIELESRTSNDYPGHQNALWYIAGL